MAETLIIILAEHNVPINFADHFTKKVRKKLVFPDFVFLRVRAAQAPCSLKVVIARIVTNFFSRNLTGLHTSIGVEVQRNTTGATPSRIIALCKSWNIKPVSEIS